MSLKGRIIPFPTKKVITTFHFSSGEKTAIISKSNQSIEQTKSDILESIGCVYMAFSNLVISTDKITHINFQYKEKFGIKEWAQILLLLIVLGLICFLTAAISTYFYFKITGKG